MKISLLSPPLSVLPYPPWGLIDIATSLMDTANEINLFDLNMIQWAGIVIPWDKIDGDIIGVSLNFSLHHERYSSFLTLLREKYPSAFIVIGGSHVTGAPSFFSSFEAIDLVGRGDGKKIMHFILQALESRRSIPKILDSKYCTLGDKVTFKHLGSSQFYSEWNAKQYDKFHLNYPAILYKGLPSNHVFYNRGCHFGCKHCVETLSAGRSSDTPSIEETLDNLALRNPSQLNVHCYFLDPTFNADKNSLINFCRLIRERFDNLIWGCNARIELFDNEMISIMAQAGCRFVEVGLEVFDDQSLNTIGKPKINGKKIHSTLDMLTSKEISIQSNFMLGLPHDNPSIIEYRIKRGHALMNHYNLLPCFWLFCPFPGSEIWENWEKKDRRINWSEMSMIPIVKHHLLRNDFVYLPKTVSVRQLREFLQFAWNMPDNLVATWFQKNRLLSSALDTLDCSFDFFIKSLFPKKIGDFINSNFFVV